MTLGSPWVIEDRVAKMDPSKDLTEHCRDKLLNLEVFHTLRWLHNLVFE